MNREWGLTRGWGKIEDGANRGRGKIEGGGG